MNPKTSQDLFNKIRSQFSNIQIGDENGAPTADPSQAVFFEFEFKEDADTYGAVSISLADGEDMKVFYNRDLVDKIDEDSKDEWYAFLKELKDFAVEHQLRFDVRDITKSNLTKQDYQNLADTNKTVNTDDMSEELQRITKLAGLDEYALAQVGKQVKIEPQKTDIGPVPHGGEPIPHGSNIKMWDKDKDKNKDKEKNEAVAEGLTGTARRSYENLEKTRLIVRHSGKVDEEIPGSRSRHIDSLYIENEDGERFKYPLTHLAGARAMARHVANGGRPHDEFGEHIVKTSEDIAKLNSFSRYVSHKDQLNDNAGDIIEKTKLQLENLREYIRNIAKQSHYEAASKDFKTAEDQVFDDETIAKLREKFTLKNLDNRVEDALPLINRIMSEFEKTKTEEPVTELDPGDEPIDAPIEPPVDHGAIVQSFLTDPNSKLVLRKDDTADKMVTVTKFKDKNTMLSSIMSDIASRMLTRTGTEDRIANFASRVADGIDKETGATFKPDTNYIKNKKIAIQLAKRYIDDYKKMQDDPAYADVIRMEPGDYNPKKDIKGKTKDETAGFEDWVNKTVAPVEPVNELEGLTFEDIKPYVSVQKGDDGKTNYVVLDKDEKEIYRTQDSKDAMTYLSKNFSQLRGSAPKVKDFMKSEDHEGATKGKYSDKEVRQAKGIAFDKRYKGGNYSGAHSTIEKLKKGLTTHPDVASALKRANENITEPLKESRTKIVETIKAKVEKEEKVTGGAGLQIARLKYLSTYH
jgi:hypothetical protein